MRLRQQIADYKVELDLLREIGEELEPIVYLGSHAEGIRVLKQQLAECQARECEKNEALRIVQAAICLAADNAPESTIGKLYDHVSKVVVMPSDSTALDTMLKQAKREALLEVADWIEEQHGRKHEPEELRRMAKELQPNPQGWNHIPVEPDDL